MVVEKNAIVLREPAANRRAGWAEASRKLADAGGDRLVWPEFGNESAVSTATLAAILRTAQEIFAE